MKSMNSKQHPHPQGLTGRRTKYRKCTCDQDMSCTMIPSSPISTKYRGEHDDTTMSSESSANSTQFSLSTCTSFSNDVDLGDDGNENVSSNRHGSISMLNSQLMNTHNCYSNPSLQHMSHKDHSHTHIHNSGNVENDSTEYVGSTTIQSLSNNSRAFGKRHHRFKEKLENIDFVLRRDDNRLKHELSKEATINHNRVIDTLMEDTDYDADYDDDVIQEELNEIIDYEQMELEERFQELNITKF